MPVGCRECSVMGYSVGGAVTEVLVATPEIERAIAENSPPERLLAAARASGTRSLWTCGCAQLLAGNTSAEELVRVIEPETSRVQAHSSAHNSPPAIVYEKPPEQTVTKITPG